MTEIDIDVMPKSVWNLYQEILDLTEVAPTVHKDGYGKILMVHGNERVQVSVSFRNPGWRWQWKSSTLTIDGEKVQIATSPEHYAAIFSDPDNGRYGYTPKGARKAKIPQMRLLDEEQIKHAPFFVTSTAKHITAAITDSDAEVKVHIAEKANEYIITVGNPKKGTVYQCLGRVGERWTMVDLFIVNIHGYDVSNEHAHGTESFLMDILGAESRNNQQSYIPEGSARSQSGMSNSVAVRKSTVFRI